MGYIQEGRTGKGCVNGFMMWKTNRILECVPDINIGMGFIDG